MSDFTNVKEVLVSMELSARNLKGVIVAIPTPFTDKDEVDQIALRKLTSRLIKNGIHGIMTCGGTGEFPHLLPEEKSKVTEVVVREAKGKVPVIACTSACGVKETIMNTKHAATIGADAAIIVPPFYFPLTEESMYQYYSEIAKASPLPIVVYNNPGYTKNNIPPQLMAKISGIEGVIGVKQSQYDISQTFEMIRLIGDKISIMTGIDSQFYQVLMLGGRGIFSTAAAVIPKQMVAIYNAVQKGAPGKALEIQKEIQVLNKFFEYDPGYVAPCKEALSMLGLPIGKARAPLPCLSAEERREMQAALFAMGLLTA